MDNKKENKRYYWLKLQSTYFNKLEQKKMKKRKDGKEMQVIYLRMMLASIDKGGYIYYQGVYDTLEEELAEEFDEDIEIIRKTLEYLQNNNMISINENFDCFIPEVLEHTGSECYSAERMRRMRSKNKMSQCDTDVTNSDTNVTSCDEETETELEKEKETETKQNSVVCSASVPVSDLFSLSELMDIAINNKIHISNLGIKIFYEEMQKSNWNLYGRPVEKENIVRVLRGYLKYNSNFSGEISEKNNNEEEILTNEDLYGVDSEEQYRRFLAGELEFQKVEK